MQRALHHKWFSVQLCSKRYHCCSVRVVLRVSCVQEDGRELLSFANSPSYVVDINIHPDFKAVVLIILFISFFASCSCCCCAYTNCEVRINNFYAMFAWM